MTTSKRALARQRRHARVRKRLSGTRECPRLSVYRSIEHIYAQIIDDENGVTLVSASTIDKKVKFLVQDKSKLEQAQIIGETVAERALEAGIKQVVFDRGGFKYHGRVKALAEASRKTGLNF